jgi:hypothetical protein
VDGWMDGCMDAWMDGCMDGWMDGWLWELGEVGSHWQLSGEPKDIGYSQTFSNIIYLWIYSKSFIKLY